MAKDKKSGNKGNTIKGSGKDPAPAMIKIKDLKLNAENPRTITAEQIDKLKQSLAEFTQMLELRPVIVDETMTVLGGNMRIRALKELGYKEVPVSWIRIVEGLSEQQKREFIIKDNVSYGSWDWDMLANQWNYDELEKWGMSEFKNYLGLTDELAKLEAGTFSDHLSKEAKEFAVTFVFPIQEKPYFEEYLKIKGKSGLVDLIVNHVKEEVSPDPGAEDD